ncbi:MAG TPA: glutamate synthase subunit alpha, partial [Acidimicrobiales bacterium]|nr:glutamate synthase subunit alpha [Acidimicrobiales bacterium]
MDERDTVEELAAPAGLYDPGYEHDACGIAFVADLGAGPSHRVVELALTALENLAHRGAFGADPDTGDGAGITVQLPHGLFASVAAEANIELPPPGAYGSGMAFLPADPAGAQAAQAAFADLAGEEGLRIVGWRQVPVDLATAGPGARQVAPAFSQPFVAWADGLEPPEDLDGLELERRLYVLRRRAEKAVAGLYFPSLSCRTFVYKGMLATHQLRECFADLRDTRLQSALAVVHSRFSTNTFPAWPLAHPYRLVAHNGEINT